jgi:hypothetical protein
MPDPVHPESARNISFVGWSDQGGRADGAQVMVNKGHAFVAHPFSGGLSVIDVRDPRAPQAVAFLPVHPRSWSIHCQAHGDLLLVIEEFDFFKLQVKDYYGKSLDLSDPKLTGKRGVDYSAGLRVYDISDPARPRAIGFMDVDGFGLHRLWWDGGRYVYATALLHGFTDHILMIVDLAEPTRPVEVGRWWLPGMWKAGGETNDFVGRVALHHAIVSGDTAYAAWRNGGITLLDISDKTTPRLIAHRNWCPPFGGNTHTALPLPDRNLLVVDDEASADISVEPVKHTWIFDIRVPENPVSIATVPVPSDQDYVAKGGQFGPHNLWENRSGGLVTSDYVFATYQSAGLRIFDIRNPFRPEEVAYFVPPPPKGWFDPRGDIKRVLHSVDVWVAPDGLMYLTDYNAGLYILQWDGV